MTRRRRLGELLREAGLIDAFQLNAALGEQTRYGARIGRALVQLGFVEEAAIVETLARQLGVPEVRLDGRRVEHDVLALLRPELAEKHACLPLFARIEHGQRVLYLAMEDPTDLHVVDELAFRIGVRVVPVITGPTGLYRAQRACWPEYVFAEDDGREQSSRGELPEDSWPYLGPDDLVYYPLSPPVAVEIVPEPEVEDDASPHPVPAVPAGEEERSGGFPGFEATSLDTPRPERGDGEADIEASASEMVRALVHALTEKALIDRADLVAALEHVRRRR